MTSAEQLRAEVEDLSRRAYELARAQATAASKRADDARAIDQRLDELVPAIQSLDGPDVGAIREAWTDARSDVMWVMSEGTLPASLRLANFLRDQASG